MPETKSALVIAAHADDMEFMAGGTIARMAALGYAIRLVIATNNKRGTLDREWSAEYTAEARREEARRGAKVLGVDTDIEFLGYEDGRLSETPLNELRERCMRAIRRHKPQVLFTWDAFTPYEEHQDHRAVAMAATEAVSFSHFPLYHPEHRDEGLEPHYCGDRFFFAKVPRDANKTVDISQYIGLKVDALCKHASQMEMTVMDLQIQLAASGLDIPHLRDAEPKQFRSLIEAQIRSWAAGVGSRDGFAFAEEFRRVRYSGIERRGRDAGVALGDEL